MALRIYANGLDSWRDEIRDAFADQVGRLRLGSYQPRIFEDDTDLPERAVVLYLSDRPVPDDADAASLRAHLDAGRAVVPVVDTLKDVPAKLPQCLHDLNAFAVGAAAPREYGPLIDEIVTRLWLRRSVRRVFLSYKRSDSSAVAHQLRDQLTRRGYDVFLDECTLHPGAAVQREIFWSLNDSDLVLLLGTENLGESRWVAEEIGTANATEVSILGVLWPDPERPGRPVRLPAALFGDQVHLLGEDAFADPTVPPREQTLTEAAFGELLDRLETYRSEGIRERLSELLEYARGHLNPRFEQRDGAELGDLELDDPQAYGSFYLRVLPFRATVHQAFDLHQELVTRDAVPAKAFLFYPENDPNDPRRRALDWVFRPHRHTVPRRYRLLSFLGDGKADLGELS